MPPELAKIVEEADTDGSDPNRSLIDYTEFIAAAMDHKQHVQESSCWAAFRVFDLNGNGKVTSDELVRLLTGSDDPTDVHNVKNIADAFGIKREEVVSIIQSIDTDGDQEMSFEEFMALMKLKAKTPNPTPRNTNASK